MSAATNAKNIKMILLDVDGVLTGGGIILDNKGNELKIFNSRDGMGITLARSVGIRTGILTGRLSECVRKRSLELKIDVVEQGHFNKIPGLLSICEKSGIAEQEIAYMGDDVLDVNVMERVGIAAAPADAHFSARKAADYVTESRGGNGAVREFIDWILEAAGLLQSAYGHFTEDLKVR